MKAARSVISFIALSIFMFNASEAKASLDKLGFIHLQKPSSGEYLLGGDEGKMVVMHDELISSVRDIVPSIPPFTKIPLKVLIYNQWPIKSNMITYPTTGLIEDVDAVWFQFYPADPVAVGLEELFTKADVHTGQTPPTDSQLSGYDLLLEFNNFGQVAFDLSNSTYTINISIRTANERKLIDEIVIEDFFYSKQEYYQFPSNPNKSDLRNIGNDLIGTITGGSVRLIIAIGLRIDEKRDVYLAAFKTEQIERCSLRKDQLGEQFVDFQYQEYQSQCEKFSDGFRIMDSMVKLYNACPELDKGTGKRAKFKKQYYKNKKLKNQHCGTTTNVNKTNSSFKKLTLEIQKALNAKGLDAGVADGIYGAKTKNAIMNYQRIIGLPVDGKVTPELLKRLSD